MIFSYGKTTKINLKPNKDVKNVVQIVVGYKQFCKLQLPDLIHLNKTNLLSKSSFNLPLSQIRRHFFRFRYNGHEEKHAGIN